MKKIRKIIWSSIISASVAFPCVMVPIVHPKNKIVSKFTNKINDKLTSFTAEIQICDAIKCKITFYDSETEKYCVIPKDCSPSGKGKLVVPSSVNYKGVNYPLVKIEKKAFKDKDKIIKGISFTNATNLKEIGEQAFYDCKIWDSDGTKLDFYNTKLVSIGSEAFYSNGSSDKGILIFPPTLRLIGSSAFDNYWLSGRWDVSKIIFTSCTIPSFSKLWGPGMSEVKTYVPAQRRNEYLEAPYFKSGADDSSSERTYGGTYYPYVTKDISDVYKNDRFLANFVNVLYLAGDTNIKMQNDLGLYFKNVATGEVDTRFKFENDIFSWDKNIEYGTYHLKICSKVDENFPDNVTFIINIHDQFKITDGTQNINVTCGQSGVTQEPWKAYLNDEEITKNLEWTFTSDVPHIQRAFHANNDGTIAWDESLDVVGIFSGVITCTYNNTISTSSKIYISVKQLSTYTIQNGSRILNGIEGNEDSDSKTWVLKKDEEIIEVEEWSIVGEHPDGVKVENGVVSWDKFVSCGVYSFSVKAKTHDPYSGLEVEAISDICTLTLVPRVTFITGGSLTLKGSVHEAGYDKQTWDLIVGDTKIENVNWSVDVDIHTEWFSVSSNGRIKWDKNIESGIYNITLSCSYIYKGATFYKTFQNNIKLSVYSSPYLVPGNYLAETTEYTAGHDDSIWSVEIDGYPISQLVNWSLESTSGELIDNIRIVNGKIIWNDKFGIGSYSFYVIADFVIEGIKYTLKSDISFTLYVVPDLNIRDGNYNLSGVEGLEGQSPNPWNIYLNNELVDKKDVNYELIFDDEIQVDHIQIDSNTGLIHWTKDIPTGIYQFYVKALVTINESIYDVRTNNIVLIIVPKEKYDNTPLILGLGLGVGIPVLFGIGLGSSYGIQKAVKKHKKK